jgi:hypothetical protein
MDKQALASAIAGGAITAALIETLFDKGVLTLDEARAILNSAMRSISPYVQESEAAFEASQKQNGVGTPYIPPMTRRLKCRIDPEQSPYTCMLPEHKPVRRGREMIDLLAVEESKPKPAKLRALSYEAAPVVQTHAVV